VIDSTLQKIYCIPIERKHFNVKCIPGHYYYCAKCNQTQRTATACTNCNGFYLQSVCVVCKSTHQNIRNHYKEKHYVFYCIILTMITRNAKYDNMISVINDFADQIKSDSDTVKKLCYSPTPKVLQVNFNEDTINNSTLLTPNEVSPNKVDSTVSLLTVATPDNSTYDTRLQQTQNKENFISQNEIYVYFCVYCQCEIASFTRDFVFLPCGHPCHASCWTIDCSSSIESADKKCPTCRASVLTEDQMDLLPLVANGRLVRSSYLLNSYNEPTINDERRSISLHTVENLENCSDTINVWSKPVRNIVSRTYSRKQRK